MSKAFSYSYFKKTGTPYRKLKCKHDQLYWRLDHITTNHPMQYPSIKQHTAIKTKH